MSALTTPDIMNMQQQIMDIAEQLIQTRGYHAFSYSDVAEQVHIRKASIHYYFPSKADLGCALAIRYRKRFQQRLRLIEGDSPQPADRLLDYAQLYRETLRNGGRHCLCGALAADMLTLPKSVRLEVAAFFQEQEAWLAYVIQDGREQRVFEFHGPSWVQAQSLLAGLQGALLTARVHDDVFRYCAIAHQMLANLGVAIAEEEIANPSGKAISNHSPL